MTLTTGNITGIFTRDGVTMAKVSVRGAVTCVVLDLLPGARVGDEVLIEAGVAIARADMQPTEEKRHVPGDSR